MPENKDLSIFNKHQIRRIWHKGEWYYSVIDVISILTESAKPNNYWTTLKRRAKTEGFEDTLLELESLKLKSPDGRMRQTDTANRQTLLRIIQSVPSPRAEPFRLWLAQVGEERIEEIENPELALERVRATYRAKGYDDNWIEERIKNNLVRNELTDEWKERGAKEGIEYAILTNEIHEGTFELSIQTHKEYKLLPNKSNLRDHLTTMELVLSSLGEATATLLHRNRDSQNFEALKVDAKDAGITAGDARRMIEERVGEKLISPQNYLHLEEQAEERRRGGKQLSLFDENEKL